MEQKKKESWNERNGRKFVPKHYSVIHWSYSLDLIEQVEIGVDKILNLV